MPAKKSLHLPPQLESQIGLQLRLAQLAVFADVVDDLKTLDLRPVDMTTLMLLEARPGMRQHLIADHLKIARPNIVGLVENLESRGLIERVVDDADRRAYQMRLTDGGRDMLEKARRIERAHMDRILKALDGVDIDNFIKGLQQLAHMRPHA